MPQAILSDAARDAYLSRSLDDWDWIKKLPTEQIEGELADLYDPAPHFKTEPFDHQLQCFLLGLNHNRFSFLLDLGTGKSKLIIDLVSQYKRAGEVRRTLVAVLGLASLDGFTKEIERHSDLTYSCIIGNHKEKLEAFSVDADIQLVTYPGLFAFVTELVEIEKGKRKKGGRKSKRQTSRKMINMIGKMTDMIAFDELHKLMKTTSGTHRVCKALSKRVDRVYGFTGTPMGRDPAAIFGQLLVVDGGETLGTSISVFKSIFYKEVESRSRWPTYTFNKKMSDTFHQMIKHRSISYDNNECFDRPVIVRTVRRVPVSEEVLRYRHQFMSRQGDAKRRTNSFVRYRQLTGGNLIAIDEDGRINLPLKYNPKVEALIEILEEIPHGSKAIVFYAYNFTGDAGERAIRESRIRHVRLWSRTKDPARIVEKFKADPNVKVLLTNWAMGGTSLDLPMANYVVYLESPESPIERVQSEGRVRPRLQIATFIYDIVMRGTVDEKILKFLKEGKDLKQALIRGTATLDHAHERVRITDAELR